MINTDFLIYQCFDIKDMLQALASLFHIIISIPTYLVLVIIISHVVINLFSKKPSVKLNNNSFVVLAGGCMGIGLQMAIQLTRLYKCHIMIIDKRKDLFNQTSKLIAQAGGSCQCKEGDLGNNASVKQLINFLLSRNKKIDLFIYNAGILFAKKAWEITQEQHTLLMNVNYFTPAMMINGLQPLLLDSHIAVTASMVAIISGGLNVSSYTASKHAIFGYLSSLRQQYKKYSKNITISIGCPYAINTTMFQGFKTKLQFIFRQLDQKYVGKRLVKEFIQKKQVCFLYQYQAVLFKLIDLMPSQVIDYCALKLDTSDYTELNKRKALTKSGKSQ